MPTFKYNKSRHSIRTMKEKRKQVVHKSKQKYKYAVTAKLRFLIFF